MRITAKGEYGCMAMISLAQLQAENRPVHIKEIAQEQSIPLSTLTQVLLKLKGLAWCKAPGGRPVDTRWRGLRRRSSLATC